MYAKLIGEVGTEIDVLYRLPLDEIAAQGRIGDCGSDRCRTRWLAVLSAGGRRKIWQGNERIEEVRQ